MGVCGLLKAVALQLLLLLLNFIRGEWPELSPLPPPTHCSFIWKLNGFSSCVSSIQSHADTTTLDLQGPIFVHEPAYKVEFSNNTGGHVHCSGHANPYPEVIQTFYLALLRPTPTARCDKILQWVSRFAPDALESRNQIRQEKKCLIKLICWTRDGQKFISFE